MAVTARQLTNRVLRALRHEEISDAATSIPDEYKRLIWQLVNKSRQEIEQAHKWRALRQNVSGITISASSNTADITGTNEHSLLMYDPWGRPLVFDTTNSSNVYQLREAQLSVIRRWNQLDNGQTASQPGWCTVDADGDNLILTVWPVPDNQRTYSVDVFIPQGELDHSSDLDTEILVPSRPVELLTLAYAYEERGEELGASGDVAFKRAERAIVDAIAQDYQAQATLNGPGQYDLQVL